MYMCKMVDNPEQEVALPLDDLTKYITINLQIFDGTNQQLSNKAQTHQLKVKCSDTIGRLFEYARKASAYGIKDYILGSDGQQFENEEETFTNLKVLDGQLFQVIHN